MQRLDEVLGRHQRSEALQAILLLTYPSTPTHFPLSKNQSVTSREKSNQSLPPPPGSGHSIFGSLFLQKKKLTKKFKNFPHSAPGVLGNPPGQKPVSHFQERENQSLNPGGRGRRMVCFRPHWQPLAPLVPIGIGSMVAVGAWLWCTGMSSSAQTRRAYW